MPSAAINPSGRNSRVPHDTMAPPQAKAVESGALRRHSMSHSDSPPTVTDV